MLVPAAQWVWGLPTSYLAVTMALMGSLTFLSLVTTGPVAPYGRYSLAKGWGFLIGAKLAWVVSAAATRRHRLGIPHPPRTLTPLDAASRRALPPQTQEIPSFAVPALWLALWATPDQLARLSAPANALAMVLFLVRAALEPPAGPPAALFCVPIPARMSCIMLDTFHLCIIANIAGSLLQP